MKFYHKQKQSAGKAWGGSVKKKLQLTPVLPLFILSLLISIQSSISRMQASILSRADSISYGQEVLKVIYNCAVSSA